MHTDNIVIYPFILKCNFWKIYKYVPGVASILYNNFYTTNDDGTRNYDELDELLKSVDIASKKTLEKIEDIAYFSSFKFNKIEAEEFRGKFESILVQKQFDKYRLIDDADNIFLLLMHLYDSYWDHNKTWYNTENAFCRFPEIEHEDLPKQYLEMKKAKQLAAFLKSYYSKEFYGYNKNDSDSHIALKQGASYEIIHDDKMNNFFISAILEKLLSPQNNLSDLMETFGDLGVGLLLDLKPKYNETEKGVLMHKIDYVLNFNLQNPFPFRNKDISYICLLLREYLLGTGIMGSTKKMLSDDLVKLFAEFLNLLDIRFSDKKYTDEDYRDNLAKTIRQFFNDNKRPLVTS